MKTAFFPRLAWSGIRKNRKLYLPYLMSCVGMVMMYDIVHTLSCSPLLQEMKGGSNVAAVLSLGKFVIAVFSALFLFYTNAFLMRRRFREFGLYNILGLDKRGIRRVILWESLFVAAIGLVGGIALGVALSKLAELGLLNAIRQDIDYRFTVSPEAIGMTLLIYSGIFLLLTLKSLWEVRKCRPLELLRSETVGEKPPKANWALAVIGLLLLAAAYYMAVTIQSPLTALTVFFVAVIMVILATYLLFIAGSVALCKALQKNKKYYYQKQHFVSVSSMAYRMKRNGAGLASICILATMVLVMISSTSSLYFGSNDSIQARFFRNHEIALETKSLDNLSDDSVAKVRAVYQEAFDHHGFTPENVCEYRFAGIAGLVTGNRVEPTPDSLDYDRVRMLYFVSVDDYNRVMGTELSLSAGEAYLSTLRCQYDEDTLSVWDMKLKLVGRLDDFISISEAQVMVVPSLCLVVPDYETLRPLEGKTDKNGDSMLSHGYYYGYDAAVSDEEAIAIYHDQTRALPQVDFLAESENGYRYFGGCLAEEKSDFFTTYGGMFFLGILLSVVFLFAAAMIMYDKQVSEGYEDQARYEILQKVGMTKQDIRKSINSQILTVFFAPLILSGIHLAFAFPLVWKLLQLFNLRNLSLVIGVTAAAFVCFAVFYALIYRLTAGAYYAIVAAGGEDA